MAYKDFDSWWNTYKWKKPLPSGRDLAKAGFDAAKGMSESVEQPIFQIAAYRLHHKHHLTGVFKPVGNGEWTDGVPSRAVAESVKDQSDDWKIELAYKESEK